MSQWRTVVVVLALAVLLLVALAMSRGLGENGPKLLSEVAWAFVFFAGLAAGKSAVEHLGKGGGARGALRSLLAEASPSEQPKPEVKP